MIMTIFKLILYFFVLHLHQNKWQNIRTPPLPSYRQGYRKWIYALKNISDKLSSVGQFGLRNTRNLSYCPIFGQLVMHMFRQCCVQHANGCRTMFCHTVQYLDSVVSNSPMVGLCCVQLSDGLWAECPTVQWSDCAFSNCPMVGQSCVQLSKGRIMLCQTVQWLDSAVSNSPMVSECWVKLSDGWPAECSTVKWSDCALSNCPMVGQCCSKQSNC